MFIVLFAAPLFVVTTILIAVVLAKEIQHIFAHIANIESLKIHLDAIHQARKAGDIKFFSHQCLGSKLLEIDGEVITALLAVKVFNDPITNRLYRVP